MSVAGEGETVREAPLITIIVMCYRTERFVGECLASIQALAGDYAFEIIAIDDCSPDNTLEEIRRFAGDPRLRVVAHARNTGHIAVINEALALARGKYIARIDSDDRYRPEFLLRTVPMLERHPEVGLVYGDAAMIDPDGALGAASSDRHHGGKDFKGRELTPLLRENFLCAPTMIARREAWLKHVPAPEGFAFSDWYFSLLIAREWEFYYVSQVLADYRVHPGNLHSRTIRDRSEEPCIFQMLDWVYERPESRAEWEREKQRARASVYASHSWTLANKYFGYGMYGDARRCYWRAARFEPRRLCSPALLRRLGATYLGREPYEKAKQWWRTAVGANARSASGS